MSTPCMILLGVLVGLGAWGVSPDNGSLSAGVLLLSAVFVLCVDQIVRAVNNK